MLPWIWIWRADSFKVGESCEKNKRKVEGFAFYSMEQGSYMILEHVHCCGNSFDEPPSDHQEAVAVDPETIGQYVREKDKAGTECYEGDIMQRYKKDGTPYKGTKVVPSIEDVKTSKIVFNESLVIGTIHDNPTPNT